jgi:phosphonate transport system ATP-binding protein
MMLVLDRVSRHFGDLAAVSNVSLTIAKGSFVGVVGRSGAGKSTLLRLINRLIEPSHGRITFDDVEVTALEGKALREWRARTAMIFQQFNLIGRLDVLSNVLIGRLIFMPTWRSLLTLWSDDDKAIALAALEQFDMALLAARRAEELSGGQQQRVAIIRALVQEPEIILADEPVSSLDPRNARLVMDTLRRINRHFGFTILCNLHSLDLARIYCDRVIGMAAGQIVFDDVPVALTGLVARDLYGVDADSSLEAEIDAGAGAAAAVAPASMGA